MIKSNIRRHVTSTVNTPISTRLASNSIHLDKAEALEFLTTFIKEKESLPDVKLSYISTSERIVSGGVNDENLVDSNLSSSLAQLKRVERDLRGLPPRILENGYESEEDKNSINKTSNGGVKRKFNDNE